MHLNHPLQIERGEQETDETLYFVRDLSIESRGVYFTPE
jgi:hypothetical protein